MFGYVPAHCLAAQILFDFDDFLSGPLGQMRVKRPDATGQFAHVAGNRSGMYVCT